MSGIIRDINTKFDISSSYNSRDLVYYTVGETDRQLERHGIIDSIGDASFCLLHTFYNVMISYKLYKWRI